MSVDQLELPYDYKMKNPVRNCLVLHINSKGAMYDTKVKEIRLYNYKILSSVKIVGENLRWWWLSDRLEMEDDKYVLKISLQNPEDFPEEFDFSVKFEKAEVIRK